MYTNPNFSFTVSICKEPYESKQETTAAIIGGDEGKQMRKDLGLKEKIGFKSMLTTPSELLQSVLSGYTFCALFSNFPTYRQGKTYVRKDGYFTLSGKSGDFFSGSYCVGIDIDETQYQSAEQFIEKLKLQPTFWYTSFSNQQYDESTGECKGSRFRLIYVFDKEIHNKYFFRYCAYKVHAMVESSTNEVIHDQCGLKCAQYFNGTNINDKTLSIDYGCSNIIYSSSDFNITIEEFISFLNDNCKYKSPKPEQKKEIKKLKCSIMSKMIEEETKTTTTQQQAILLSALDVIEQSNSNTESIGFNFFLVRDAYSLDWSDFHDKYKRYNEYVFRTEREDWSSITDSKGNIIQFQYCDEDYLELKWIPRKLKDGQHRKRTLFHRGWLRRLIKPTITPDELLYNLLFDREHFFDNSDQELSVYRLQEIVRDCFEYEADSYITQYENIYLDTIDRCRKKQVIIHRTCKGLIRANSLCKELRWKFLDEAYNKSLSVTENLQILNDSDFIICRATLYNYCVNRGIVTRKKAENMFFRFKELHQDYMSCRNEQQYLAENGLKLSLGTIQAYRPILLTTPNIKLKCPK